MKRRNAKDLAGLEGATPLHFLLLKGLELHFVISRPPFINPHPSGISSAHSPRVGIVRTICPKLCFNSASPYGSLHKDSQSHQKQNV